MRVAAFILFLAFVVPSVCAAQPVQTGWAQTGSVQTGSVQPDVPPAEPAPTEPNPSESTQPSAPKPRAAVKLRERVIDFRFTWPHEFQLADLDNDGDPDLIAAQSEPHNALVWYANVDGERFARSNLFPRSPRLLYRLRLGDLDLDGRLDIAVTGNVDGVIGWFRGPRNTTLARWQPFPVTESVPHVYESALADLDGDRDLDIVVWTDRDRNRLSWLENNGAPALPAWSRHTIFDDIAESALIAAVDLDADGDQDLVVSAGNAGQIHWYQNPGTPVSRPWRRHVIARIPSPMHGQMVDMDRDGDLDLVIAAGLLSERHVRGTHRVVWFENPAVPAANQRTERPALLPPGHSPSDKRHAYARAFGEPDGSTHWKPHLVGRLTGAIWAVAGDLDNDGDMDVVATSWNVPGRLVWFENWGDPKSYFSVHPIKSGWRNAGRVELADFNGDGRLDIVAAAGEGTDELRWWENLAPSPGPVPRVFGTSPSSR